MQGKPVGILLTHGHYDHILAAEEIRKEYGISIYACREESRFLGTLRRIFLLTAVGCSLSADVWLTDLEVFEAAGFSVQMLHTPGHTQEAAAII